MLEECSSKVLEFLNETERVEKYRDFRCFIKKENKFNIYIFTTIYEDTDELDKNWRKLSNDLAWFFQANLEKDIERWNLYIIYFVRNEVDKNLQYTIEQDKYSTRKIVIDEFCEEDDIIKVKEMISDKLFDIKIGGTRSSDTGNLIKIIQDNDNYLFELLNKNLEDDEILDRYLMEESDET